MPQRSARARAPRDAVHHPLFARYYARCSVGAGDGHGRVRRRLLAGLSGRVIEVGAGNGLNFSHYPGTRLPRSSPSNRSGCCGSWRWRRRCAEVPVDVAPGAAEALPVKSEAFDAAVVSLVLCSVRDVPRALARLRQVLRPGGQVRFFEHGRGGGQVMTFTQRALDRTLWPPCPAAATSSRELPGTGRAAERRGSRWGRPPAGDDAGERPGLQTSSCALGRPARRPEPVRGHPLQPRSSPAISSTDASPFFTSSARSRTRSRRVVATSTRWRPGRRRRPAGGRTAPWSAPAPGRGSAVGADAAALACGVAVDGRVEGYLGAVAGDRGDEGSPVGDLRITGSALLGEHQQPGEIDGEVVHPVRARRRLGDDPRRSLVEHLLRTAA